MDDIHSELNAADAHSKRLAWWKYILAFLALAAFIVLMSFALEHSQAGSIPIGESVPDLTLTTFDGQNISTSQMQGKVIFINFWASWCQPCASEATLLEQAYNQYQAGGQVAFIGIDYIDTESNGLSFIKQYSITYPNGPDLGSRISQIFNIQGVPETYIFDRQGHLAFKQLGPFSSLSAVTDVINPLLK